MAWPGPFGFSDITSQDNKSQWHNDSHMNTLPWILLLAVLGRAQTAPKPLPPPGIEVPASDRAELQSGLEHLHAATAKLGGHPLAADVLIYEKAVRYALEYQEFFKADEIAKAKMLLREGEQRAAQLAD
jgi:hypothetical protein